MNVKAHVDTKKPYLIPETDYKIQIHIDRLGHNSRSHDGRIYAPRFPKPQFESWWIVLGDPETDELLAMKRLSMRNGPNETLSNKATTHVTFETPARLGKHRYILFLMSDGYLGLDQQIDIEFETRMDLDS